MGRAIGVIYKQQGAFTATTRENQRLLKLQRNDSLKPPDWQGDIPTGQQGLTEDRQFLKISCRRCVEISPIGKGGM